MKTFEVFVLTPPSLLDRRLVVAASRAGAVGILNGEWGDAPHLSKALEDLSQTAKSPFGLKYDGQDLTLETCLGFRSKGLEWLVLSEPTLVRHPSVQAFRRSGGRLLFETWALDDISIVGDSIDGLWLKGHEAGGLVGEESSFVLLQRALQHTALPVYVRGGVGLHTAAACAVGGAAGVVLDNQLLLLRDSSLRSELTPILKGWDGTETLLLGNERQGVYLRGWSSLAPETIEKLRFDLEDASLADLKRVLEKHCLWKTPTQSLLPLGQEAAFAAPWAERFGTLGRCLKALFDALYHHPSQALHDAMLAPDSPLARFHKTRYPIVQGAMTRVSDSPPFTEAVAEAGALPMVALAMLKGQDAKRLLEETRMRLKDRPWGVGLLGFVPKDLRDAQISALMTTRPPFAYIAGGRPDQALPLEREGIPTYLHTPTPKLLALYLEQGARHFILEGRECGGHIGPLSSFVLWESAVETLLDREKQGIELPKVALLFAGGIHDARSAAMVATLAAPLTQKGVRCGILMGTAYLFTREAVVHGAITSQFQAVARECRRTATLTVGPGHASRCALTPFVENFHATRKRLWQEKLSPREIRTILDELTLGRLRIATKGIMRHGEALRPITLAEQTREGMFMIGQVGALCDEVHDLATLHRSVSDDAMAWLQRRQPPPKARTLPPADIAIIGMSVLLPGAQDIPSYWKNILEGVESLEEIPPHRWNWRLYYDPDPKVRDKVYSKWGGFLKDVAFDPSRYGLPPRAIPSIDPLQLLTLEAVSRALEDADLLNNPCRERISVILGASGGLGELGIQYGTRSDLPRFLSQPDDDALDKLPEWTEDSFAGLLLNVAAGRTANRFDFGGTNSTVDAACASSLAAVHQAINELLLGQSDIAVTGGIDTMQSPFAFLCFSKTQALSPKGKCLPFDQEADGIAISEGLAILVLKRLSDAERDGDRIYAVIKGVGTSSDGRAKGLTAPHAEGQLRALTRAYQQANCPPHTVGLLEAHGTGTVAGDRTELQALLELMDSDQAPPKTCAVGSVKRLIGHTKSAAGAAGLIKAALALYHRVLPPHPIAHPQSILEDPQSPLYRCRSPLPWVRHPDDPNRAGVSAFGFGGTNFHVVLEEYCDDIPSCERPSPVQTWPQELFLWCGKDVQHLADALQSALARIASHPQPAALARELARALPEKGERLAIVASSLEELKVRIQEAIAYLKGKKTCPKGVYHTPQPLGQEGKLVFLFPGQGSQHPLMFSELACAFPACLEILDQANALVTLERPLSWYIYQDAAKLKQPEIAQPAIGAVSAAALALLKHLGLQADMTAGHSYGEYVALYAAGALTLKDLLRLSKERGGCIQGIGGELGTMMAVKADRSALDDLIASHPDVVLANRNSPDQMVLSGTRKALEAVQASCAKAGLTCTFLPVGAGFHSPLVAPAKTRLSAILDTIAFSSPRIPVYSNTTTLPYPEDPKAIRSLLGEHLVSPVDFVQQIDNMYGQGARVFLEIGPKAILSRLVGRILGDRPHIAASIDGTLAGLLHALAILFCHGIAFDPLRLFEGREKQDQGFETPPPKHLWLVNGGHASPPRSSTEKNLPAPKTPQDVSSTEVTAPMRSHRINNPSSEDEAFAAYQETMRQFLKVQERVMMAYLGREEIAPLEETRAPSRSEIQAVPPPTPVSGIEHLQAPLPVEDLPAEPSATQQEAVPIQEKTSPQELPALLLRIASERTGYPVDMLGLDQNIEADLGIDSIKRIEILGAFQKHLPPSLEKRFQSDMETFSTLQTFGAFIEHLERWIQGEGEETRPFEDTGKESAALSRFIPKAHHEPVDHLSVPPLPKGGYILSQDALGIAPVLETRLRREGVHASIIPDELWEDPDGLGLWLEQERRRMPLRGFIHLSALGRPCWDLSISPAQWRQRMDTEVKPLFGLLRLLKDDLSAEGRLVVASAMGGYFGRHDLSSSWPFPAAAALSGLVKTLALEWNTDPARPSFWGKCVDLDPALPKEILAEQLFQELALPGGRREVGYPQGKRTVFRTVAASLLKDAPLRQPDENWVILATGGARGITAEALRAFLPYRPTFILVGRTPLPEPLPDPIDRLSPEELRRHFIESKGRDMRPSEVEEHIASILKRREILANLKDFEAAGIRVDYRVADVRNEQEIIDLLDGVYRDHGRIDAVLHGAGIIQDQLLAQKTMESVTQVLDTKVNSTFFLMRHLRPEGLKFVTFFTSVAGRFGNRGQSDYATANEFVNRMAWLYQQHLGPETKVAAINWNPWAGTTHGQGMVTEAIRRQFEARGIDCIQPFQGQRFLLKECLYGPPEEVEIIAGDAPWEVMESRANPLPAPPGTIEDDAFPLLLGGRQIPGGFEKNIDLASDPYLDHHRLDRIPVMPLAMACEYFAEAAEYLQRRPVTEIRAIQRLAGLRLEGDACPIRLDAEQQANQLSLSLRESGQKRPAYRASIAFGDVSQSPTFLPKHLFGASSLDPLMCYRQWLFHGPSFQTIETIEGLDERGIRASLSLAPSPLMDPKWQDAWRVQPFFLDGAFQLVVIWSRALRNTTPLPSRIGRLRRFGREPFPSRLMAHVDIVSSPSDPHILCHIALLDTAGRVRLSIEDFEGTADASLNRLGGIWGDPDGC